ncbi:MAG: ABC transporter ATP-binding protein [Thermoplasmata archaeon]|nr:ABC transporter ATP-binding protein [Thermoplasmata archaeon]
MALEFQNVSKRFWPNRTPALRDLTLKVEPGEVLGLVGRNGAGKTTAIRIAAGVSLPGSGNVQVDGHPLDREKVAASRLLGWVPEESVHEESAKVEPLLRYYAAIVGDVEPARIGELLETWGLTQFRRRRVRTLSLGMRRRLSLIASELTQPKYLLLDEVFNGLDPEAVVTVRAWVRERRAAGCGLLLSSHNLRELAKFADRVAVLHEGRLLKVLDRAELHERPSRVVRVQVPGFDEAGLRVLERFGTPELVPGGALVRGEGVDAGGIAAALVHAGYVVQGLTREDDGLEELYLELVRGAT